MDIEALKKNIDTIHSFDFNGYTITNIGVEGNGRLTLYHNPLHRYRVYNYCSPVGDYEVFDSKEELIAYATKENKYIPYYNRLSELNSNLDFDFSYNLYKYLNDWIYNYFGYRRADFQIKYRNGNFSKMCKAAYMYIDEYGTICIESEDNKQYIEIDPTDTDLELLIVRFRQRIKGSIKTQFPINFIGTYKSTYDSLESKCLYEWWDRYLDNRIESAYKNKAISEQEYKELLNLREKRGEF